jgi:hypothetical protein
MYIYPRRKGPYGLLRALKGDVPVPPVEQEKSGFPAWMLIALGVSILYVTFGDRLIGRGYAARKPQKRSGRGRTNWAKKDRETGRRMRMLRGSRRR